MEIAQGISKIDVIAGKEKEDKNRKVRTLPKNKSHKANHLAGHR